MIRTERAHLQVVARSHPGLIRTNNEDRFAVTAYWVSRKDHTPSVFAVLADGIGGHRAGEVAAEIAVNQISHVIAQSDASQPLPTLQEAITTASQSILAHAQQDAGQQGMGATCVCAWVIGNALFTASVGDSRLYLLRDQSIRQVSTDHTWVQEAVEHGLLDRDQARYHRNSHVIRRYLGSPTPPQVDLRLRLNSQDGENTSRSNQGLRLHLGDILLLCSDGLTDLETEEDILDIIKGQPLEAAAQALIDLALQRGGHDNITVVLMQTPTTPVSSRKNGWSAKKLWRWLTVSCLGLLVLLAAAVAMLLLFDRNLAGSLPINLPFRQPTASPTELIVQQTLLPIIFETLTPTPIASPTIQAIATMTAGPSPTAWPTDTPAH